MNARSLTTLTGFCYEHMHKTLRRMYDDGHLACPARGLYTTPDHPCLEHLTITPTSAPPAEPPIPTVATVPTEPQPAAAPKTPSEPPDPIAPATSPAAPDPAHNQDAGSQTAPVSNVSTVPGASTSPAAPDPAHDQDANPQTAPVPNAPTVPTSGPSQPPTNTFTAPDESAGEWESDPDQQPGSP